MKPSRIHPEYFQRIIKFAELLRCTTDNFELEIRRLYEEEKMSADEIAEKLSAVERITSRSVLRWLEKTGERRKKEDAFRLAASRGRVVWAYRKLKDGVEMNRKQLSQKTRYLVKERDGFRCVLCGANPATGALLEIDHIIPRCDGGSNKLENLRTVCYDCNMGKRLANNESGSVRIVLESGK
ncbi:MAG: HNH endonuclease [Syntrophorhabdaceae bacterium]|nr:HNH endonuclease [Syntrophorhabdaceae bacterium]